MSAVTRLSAAAVAATLAFAVPVQAQVNFAGFTNGCFYTVSACTPGTTNENTTVNYGFLTFRTGSFMGTSSTLDGSLGIGEAPANPNIGNLGSFRLDDGTFNYNPGSFVLRVTFTAPAGTTPGNQLFTADLIGSVTGTSGGVNINFNNDPLVFSYDGGTFTFKVDDVSLIRNPNTGTFSEVPVTGFIVTTVIPEPSTYLLMASGLAGLGLVGYRRRRQA